MEKKVVGLICYMFLVQVSCFAQVTNKFFTSGLGYTKNAFYGKGDFGGFYLSSSFFTPWRGKWGFQHMAAVTVHEGIARVRYEDINNIWQVGEIRHMTGGLQASTEITFSLISSKSHTVWIGLGPVMRYQVTTFPQYGWVNFYPDFYFSTKRYERYFGVGGIGSINYSYAFANRWVVQAKASLQYVSQDDNQNMFGFSVGKILSELD
jgi:hypothetical protein